MTRSFWPASSLAPTTYITATATQAAKADAATHTATSEATTSSRPIAIALAAPSAVRLGSGPHLTLEHL